MILTKDDIANSNVYLIKRHQYPPRYNADLHTWEVGPDVKIAAIIHVLINPEMEEETACMLQVIHQERFFWN